MAAQRIQFSRLKNEAKRYLRIHEANKSLKCLNSALIIRPNHIDCLINRSSAYLYLGDMDKALRDANVALKLDPDNTNVWRQKADVHYTRCEFELALLWYHNGLAVRPNEVAFESGIYKSEAAMKNCVGQNSYLASIPNKVTGNAFTKMTLKNASQLEEEQQGIEDNTSEKDSNFLHELSEDRTFIIKLLKYERERIEKFQGIYRPINTLLERSLKRQYRGAATIINYNRGFKSDKIYKEATKLVKYLIPRNDFWRNSISYSERKAKATPKLVRLMATHSLSSVSFNLKEVVLEMVRAEMFQFQNDYRQVIEIAESLLEHLKDMLPAVKQYYPVIITDLYSIIGCSYMELGMNNEAYQYFEMDYNYGMEHQLSESRSRALDYLGIVSFRNKNYEKAIEVWSEKLDFVKGILEHCWLFHEMGRCHLETGDHLIALDYAKQAIEKSIEGMDDQWKLNAVVLAAKIYERMNQYTAAVGEYKKAIEICKEMKMEEPIEDLHKLIDNLNRVSKDAVNLSKLRESIRQARLSRKMSLKKTDIFRPRNASIASHQSKRSNDLKMVF